MRRRKPKIVEAGKCYRLNAWYGLGQPSDVVVYVYAIEGARQRQVRMRAIGGHELGFNCEGYTSFLRRVHSEVPLAIN